MTEIVNIQVRIKEDGSLEVKKLGSEFEKLAKKTEKSTKRMSSSFSILKGSIIALSGTAVLGGFVIGMKKAISASNKLENSLLGLKSVAKSTGQDIDKTTQAAQDFAADGLINVADASESLKNLLIKGFGLPEAIDLLNSFKDSAAFGRQGQLSLGEAVRGATEGLKNELSTLLDNAGITKNLSIIWKEYAVILGKGVKSLTEAEKRQAVYNGIMKEAKPFLGDAGKLTEIYNGKTQALQQSIFNLSAVMGTQLKQELVGSVSDTNDMIVSFTKLIDESNAVGEIIKLLIAPFQVLSGTIGFLADSVLALIDMATKDLPKFGSEWATRPIDAAQALTEQVDTAKGALKLLLAIPKEDRPDSTIAAIKAIEDQITSLEDRISTIKSVEIDIKTKKDSTIVENEPVNKKTLDLRSELLDESLRIIADSNLKELQLTQELNISKINAQNEFLGQTLSTRSDFQVSSLTTEQDIAEEQTSIWQQANKEINTLSENRLAFEQGLSVNRQAIFEADKAAFALTSKDGTAIAQNTANLLLELNASNTATELEGQIFLSEEKKRIWEETFQKFQELEGRKTDISLAGIRQEILGAKIVAQAKAKFDREEIQSDENKKNVLSSSLSFLSGSALRENKKTFNIAKAASIAQATMSTFAGANKAFELPFPANFAISALIIAAGLANVSKIASTSFGGGAPSGGGASASASTIPSISQTPIISEPTQTENTGFAGTLNVFINDVALDVDKDRFARDIMPHLERAFRDNR